MDWLFALHYVALAGCALGFLFTGNRTALILIAYNFLAFGWYWATGTGTPEWFIFGDVIAAGLIMAFCPVNWRNGFIVAGYAACIVLYGSEDAGLWTRVISIAQFALCWPFIIGEWTPSVQRLMAGLLPERIARPMRRTNERE